jgi:hypothetical protein
MTNEGRRAVIRRFLLWSTGILVALIVAVVLAFWLSPWPSVAVITYMYLAG